MSRIRINKIKCIKTEETCSHSRQVENADNSYFVCDNCGLQLQQIFRCAYNNYDFVKYNRNNVYEFIDNCVRRLNLPECMTKEIFDHFMKIEVKRPHKDAIHLASYSIYNYLILVGHGVKLKDIVDVTKVYKHDILKHTPQHSTKFNDVEDILENISLIPFKLTESDRIKIISISDKFLDNGNSPYSIAGALTQIYSSFINKKITNKIISKYFRISGMTLFRAKRLIEEEVIAILEVNRDMFDVPSKRHSLWSNARNKIFDNFYNSNEKTADNAPSIITKNVSKNKNS